MARFWSRWPTRCASSRSFGSNNVHVDLVDVHENHETNKTPINPREPTLCRQTCRRRTVQTLGCCPNQLKCTVFETYRQLSTLLTHVEHQCAHLADLKSARPPGEIFLTVNYNRLSRILSTAVVTSLGSLLALKCDIHVPNRSIRHTILLRRFDSTNRGFPLCNNMWCTSFTEDTAKKDRASILQQILFAISQSRPLLLSVDDTSCIHHMMTQADIILKWQFFLM